MKKLLHFLRSMTFGMLLLVLVIVLCLAGSLIVQDRAADEYVRRYGEQGASVLLWLGLDHVFTTPVFLAAGAALCLNLIACSISRFPRLRKRREALCERAEKAELTSAVSQDGRARIDKLLRRRRFWVCEQGGRTLYLGHAAGFYGSFLMHLSILLLVVVGAVVLTGAEVIDQSVMPGEAYTLADGTQILVDDFRIEDDTGRLDYMSTVRVQLPSGEVSAPTSVRVNEPLRFGDYKIYQQTYGTAGRVSIVNNETGGADTLALTEASFLTLDGRSGLYYQALYPGYVVGEGGAITLITSTSGAYPDPVYEVMRMEDGHTEAMLLFPGDELTVGAITFRMEAPLEFPGLRIKHQPALWLGLLYAVFGLMIAALWLCFFYQPVCVAMDEKGYAVVGPKGQTGLTLMLESAATQKEE